jgi:hypothetical protein
MARGTEESSPSPLTAGGTPLVMGREVHATEGPLEEARTDAGAVLRPHSTGEGGEPQDCHGTHWREGGSKRTDLLKGNITRR